MLNDMTMPPNFAMQNLSAYTLWLAATLAQSEVAQDAGRAACIPTSPPIFSKWCGTCDLFGCCAKTFQQTTPTNSLCALNGWATEPRFLRWTARRLRLNLDRVRSLSECLHPQGFVPQKSFLSEKALRGIVRRATKWGRSLDVLRRDTATITVKIIMFSNPDVALANLLQRNADACKTLTMATSTDLANRDNDIYLGMR